jgi:RNA polymerase sigma factor (sigma-70 family)
MTAAVDFDTWYREHHPRLVRSMVVLSGDPHVAAEIVDEAAARCLKRWWQDPPLDDPAAWTYRVAVNLLHRRSRKAALERQALAYLDTPEGVTLSEPSVELWREVARLPPRQRTAVVLRYVGGLTQAQVAQAMRISTGTASATLAAARRRLAERLDPEGQPSHAS